MKKAEADLGVLESWLPGLYDNVDQPTHTALSVGIVPIYMPTFGDHVYYLQESAADDPRRITTQRLLSFTVLKGGRIMQSTYTLAQPGRWRDGHLNPDLFKGMMYQDAIPLAGCDIEWKKEEEKFVGANNAATCRMRSAAVGGAATTQMRTELTPGELSIAELAFGPNGQVVQGNAAEPFYRYRKRSGL